MRWREDSKVPLIVSNIRALEEDVFSRSEPERRLLQTQLQHATRVLCSERLRGEKISGERGAGKGFQEEEERGQEAFE